MNLQNEVCAIVVWYNPDLNQAKKAISTYKSSVGKVIIIDNSNIPLTTENSHAFRGDESILYYSLGSNEGIALALNKGMEVALELGYKYALTMDQDSSASIDMVKKLYSVAQTLNKERNNYAIFAAQPDTPQRKPRKTTGLSLIDSAITSGNLVLLDAYKRINGFRNDLFIDYVDCWFSLSLRQAGYKLVQVNDALLYHQLGSIKKKKILGIEMYPTNHSALRHYYISRNRLYLISKYRNIFPQFIKWEKKNYLKILIKLMLFEGNKLHKFRMILRGRKDFHRGISGKYK